MSPRPVVVPAFSIGAMPRPGETHDSIQARSEKMATDFADRMATDFAEFVVYTPQERFIFAPSEARCFAIVNGLADGSFVTRQVDGMYPRNGSTFFV